MAPSHNESTFLLHVTGQDRPGITAALMKTLDELNVRILDIEQAVVHKYLSLHVMIENCDQDLNGLILIVQNALSDFSVNIRAKDVEGNIEIPDPANRFVTTVIANGVSPGFILKVTRSIAEFDANIDSIRKLNNGGLETIEFTCTAKDRPDLKAVTNRLLGIASQYKDIDLAVQRENLYRRSKRMVVFDMDSTLLKGEVIDELAEQAGKKEIVAAITQEAMEGKIDFQTSLFRRVEHLKGLTLDDMQAVADRMEMNPGANTLLKVLKKLGFKIAIVSGGFTFFAEKLRDEFGLHYVCANKLEIDQDGKITGKIDGPIIDAQKKADLVELLAQQEGILLDQVIAIGDGANDLLMIERAGLGIAFNAKPVTRENADTTLTKKGLTSLLYFLGITDNEIKEMGFKISSLRSQHDSEESN